MKRERETASASKRARVYRRNFPPFPCSLPSLFFLSLPGSVRTPLSDVSTPRPTSTIDHRPTFVTRFRHRPKTIAVINLNGFFRRPSSTSSPLPPSPPPLRAIKGYGSRARLLPPPLLPPPPAGTFDLARKNRGLATALVNPSRARRFGSDSNATS